MLQSVNIQIPDDMVQMLDELSQRGDSPEDRLSQRSTLITVALHHYSEFLQKSELREQVKAGVTHRAERDRQLSEEWFSLEDELCHDLIG